MVQTNHRNLWFAIRIILIINRQSTEYLHFYNIYISEQTISRKLIFTFSFLFKKNPILLLSDYQSLRHTNNINEAAHAVQNIIYVAIHIIICGLGWDDSPRHNKGVYLTLCS